MLVEEIHPSPRWQSVLLHHASSQLAAPHALLPPAALSERRSVEPSSCWLTLGPRAEYLHIYWTNMLFTVLTGSNISSGTEPTITQTMIFLVKQNKEFAALTSETKWPRLSKPNQNAPTKWSRGRGPYQEALTKRSRPRGLDQASVS